VSTSADKAHTQDASKSMTAIRRIGVVGLGHMGSAFAENLIADGYQMTVYDRNEKNAAPLVAKGATAAAGIGDLAGSEAILTSLPDDDALEAVTLGDPGLIHALAPGAIHVSMSTVSPGLSRSSAGSRNSTSLRGRRTWRLRCWAIPILRAKESSS